MENNKEIELLKNTEGADFDKLFAPEDNSLIEAAGVMTDEQTNQIENLAAAIAGQNNLPVYHLPRKTKPIHRVHSKVHRNDPCPCGSGKKYKNCCLSSGKYEKLVETGKEDVEE